MKKFTVSENVEIVADGKRILLEAGDRIVINEAYDLSPSSDAFDKDGKWYKSCNSCAASVEIPFNELFDKHGIEIKTPVLCKHCKQLPPEQQGRAGYGEFPEGPDLHPEDLDIEENRPGQATTTVKFSDVPAGGIFAYDDSKWIKRHDNLGADLLGRDGGVSFIGGKRHIQSFKPETLVTRTRQ